MTKKLYGTDPDQVPTNADLGSAAYADTQNMPETRLTNQPLSAKFGANGDVPTDLASTLDFMQISGSTFIQTGSDAQAFVKSNHYWNGGAHGFVDTGRGSTTIRLNENNAGQIWFETAPSGGVATLARMIIDENGVIRKPYQPAFLARPASPQSNLPLNATTTIAFGTEIFDQNADFNNSTNRFTAPVTGKYLLTTGLYSRSLDHDTTYYQLELATSNGVYYDIISMSGFDADVSYYEFKICVLADMDAGDVAYVRMAIPNNGAAQVQIDTASSFSGHLVA